MTKTLLQTSPVATRKVEGSFPVSDMGNSVLELVKGILFKLRLHNLLTITLKRQEGISGDLPR